MSTFYVTTELRFVGPPEVTTSDFCDFAWQLADELHGRDTREEFDQGLAGALEDRILGISMGVKAADRDQAVLKALGAVQVVLRAVDSPFLVAEQAAPTVEEIDEVETVDA
jgi:hypothetical protein